MPQTLGTPTMDEIKLEQIAAMRDRMKATADLHQEALGKAQKVLAALDEIEAQIRSENTPAPSLTLPGVDAAPPRPERKVPFAQAVRDVVMGIQGEFTVFDVEEALRKTGQQLPAKHTRTRITLELIPMAQKGILTRTFAGKGTAPHRYRVNKIRLRPTLDGIPAQTH